MEGELPLGWTSLPLRRWTPGHPDRRDADHDGTEDDQVKVFKLRDPFASSKWYTAIEPAEESLFTLPEFDVTTIQFDHPYASSDPPVDPLSLPPLDSFTYGPIPALDPPDTTLPSPPSSSTSELPSSPSSDIWSLPSLLLPPLPTPQTYSWARFLHPSFTHTPLPPLCLSEAPLGAFDSALLAHATLRGTSAGHIVPADLLFRSLRALALGRESALFRFDRRARTFVPRVAGVRTSGCSRESMAGVVARLTALGATWWRLRRVGSGAGGRRCVALGTVVREVVQAVEAHMGVATAEARSVVQLLAAAEWPGRVLVEMERLVAALEGERVGDAAEVCSRVFEMLVEQERSNEWMRPLLLEIADRLCRPFLDGVAEWIGVKSEGAAGVRNADLIVDPQRMPTIIGPEEAQIILETGTNLQIVRAHEPDHPLVNLSSVGVEAPAFRWRFEWKDVERITRRAKQYEEDMRRAVACWSKNRSGARLDAPMHTPNVGSDETYDDFFARSIAEMNLTPSPTINSLAAILRPMLDPSLSATSSSTIPPPISLTPYLSLTPLLTTQSTLVSRSVLRLLFRTHHLTGHLRLQHAYHLLGNPYFRTALTSALFNPDLPTTERHRDTVRLGTRLGLRLAHRDESSWPPASSELRLALAGILGESYAAALPSSSTTSSSTNLIRHLSFSIRTLPPAALDRVLDPSSLHALDFLRLDYRPPPPVDAVLTPAALASYDAIFAFLLRLTRVAYVVARVPWGGAESSPRASARGGRREETAHARLRWAARHFVDVCVAHFCGDVVGEGWARFERYLAGVEARVDDDQPGDDGVDALRARHEGYLDEVAAGCLLRRWQLGIRERLEEVWGCVLAFAEEGGAEAQAGMAGVEALRGRFAEGVERFVEALREEDGRRRKGEGVDGEEGSAARLLARLEAGGYYGR